MEVPASVRARRDRIWRSACTFRLMGNCGTDRSCLQRLGSEYKRFSRAAGLRTEAERAQVAGFGRSPAAKAVALERKLGKSNLKLYELDITRRKRLSNHPELVLPGVQDAVLEDKKFTEYLFNPNNPRGWAKGVAITSRLGYDISNWEELAKEIRSRAALFPATAKGDKGHGPTYEQRLILFGKKRQTCKCDSGMDSRGRKTSHDQRVPEGGGEEMEIPQYTAVRLKDGREGVAVEVFENGDILVDVGSSPEDWDTIWATEDDVVELLPQ